MSTFRKVSFAAVAALALLTAAVQASSGPGDGFYAAPPRLVGN